MYRGYSRNRYISIKLSKVMGEIGVTEDIIERRRETYLLNESLLSLYFKLIGMHATCFYFGSQSEGTTTVGLHSDFDLLISRDKINVVQSLDDGEKGNNYLIVIDESTTKGYCYIKPFTKDEETHGVLSILTTNYETRNNNFLININTNRSFGNEKVVNGPAIRCSLGLDYLDIVHAFYCPFWPKSASGWLYRQGRGGWPTQEMKIYCISKGYFLVPVGSKVSTNPDIEWRISTSLAERCLMFSLNITQLRCYVLMKMITKSYFEIDGETRISSFMCKTALFHCIENSEPSMWTDDNLYISLYVCLLQLRFFVLSETCPHFIITENNLMAGQFTVEEKYQLLNSINKVLNTYGLGIFCIEIDDLGKRLQIKMDIISPESSVLISIEEIMKYVLSDLNVQSYIELYSRIKELSCIEQLILSLSNIHKLIKFNTYGSAIEKTACHWLLPELYSLITSVTASSVICQSGHIPEENLAYFKLASETVTNKLKLASIHYCSGNIKGIGDILMDVQGKVNMQRFYFTCESCKYKDPPDNFWSLGLLNITEMIRCNYIVSCVWFGRGEFNCMPLELQYELFKYGKDDIIMPHIENNTGLKLAVVDCLPFLYFLQYKTNSLLQKNKEKEQALSELAKFASKDTSLGHQETTLNLLGQCYELEHMIEVALQCYMVSLQIRQENNVAKWHICKLLADIVRRR